MEILAIILVFVSVLLVIVGAVGLISQGPHVVTQRLKEAGTKPVREREKKDRAVELKDSLRLRLTSFGERLKVKESTQESTKQKLMQAGYRGRNAIYTYFATRFLAVFGGAALALAISTVFTTNPAIILLAVMYFVVAGWLIPRFWLLRKIKVRQHALRLSLPDAADLLVICVEAGLGLNQALLRTAQEVRHSSPELSQELRILNFEIQAGTTRIDAFRNLASRTGAPDIQSLTTMLIQADRFGASIGQALRVFADTLRTKRRQRAEEAANKTSIKISFPLVFFIFPAMFVVILAPALIQIIEQMGSLG